ncbi:MAG: hemerythrin domain-containing protein [Steroidobacteraceae bacterium]
MARSMPLGEAVLDPRLEVSAPASPEDAISLLRADHRQVAGWFQQYGRARSRGRKQELVRKICRALTVHMAIKEDIFYPAFLDATGNTVMYREAGVDDMVAADVIEAIEASDPEDYFDAKISVLAEMMRRHVEAQESPGGMLSAATNSEMDLERLGDQMLARKKQLQYIFSNFRRASSQSVTAMYD